MAGSVPSTPASATSHHGSVLHVLVDTNVALDVMLAREPWASQARPIFDAHDAGRVMLYLPASVLTDIFYICRKQVGIDRAKEAVAECLRRYNVLPVDRTVLQVALDMPNSDFEDNVQIACAQAAGLAYILTRNMADFAGSPVPVIEPAVLAAKLTAP